MNSRISRTLLAAGFTLILLLCLFFSTPTYPDWVKEEYYDAFKGITKTWTDHDGLLGKVKLEPEPATGAQDITDLSTTTPSASKNVPKKTSPPQSTPPNHTCSLTKASMLYGSHQYPQMTAALETHARHATRWNCTFTTLTQDIAPSHRLYSKQYYLLSLLLSELSQPPSSRQSWLMWVDADSILLNPAISPEAFLPPPALNLEDVYALVTADHNGLNAGIFYLKVCEKSVELLTRTVAFPLENPDIDLGWFGEQAAMARVIDAIEKNGTTMTGTGKGEGEGEGEGGYPGIVWVPRDWWNLYQTDEHGFQGKEGDVLVHFAGLGATRLGHMQDWLDELEVNPGKWEVAWEKTRFKEEVGRFWGQFVANYTKGLDGVEDGRRRDR